MTKTIPLYSLFWDQELVVEAEEKKWHRTYLLLFILWMFFCLAKSPFKWESEIKGHLYWTLFFTSLTLCGIGGLFFLAEVRETGRAFYLASTCGLICCSSIRLYRSKLGIESLACRLYAVLSSGFYFIPDPGLATKLLHLTVVWGGLAAIYSLIVRTGASNPLVAMIEDCRKTPLRSTGKYILMCYQDLTHKDKQFTSWDPFLIALGVLAIGHTFLILGSSIGASIAWATFLLGAILYVDSCARWAYFEERESPEAWAWTVVCIFLVPCAY